MKVSVYIAASFDGFIARPDGALDWLPGSDPNVDGEESAVDGAGEGEDMGWGAFWDSVDCLVLGRKSFEAVLGFDVAWPYEGTRVIVLSRNPTLPVPPELTGKVEIYGGDLQALAADLAAGGYQRVYVDGGQTIQSFLRQGLVTDMTISTAPVLIGEGIPLFGSLPADIPLRHMRTESYPNSFVQSVYEIATG